MKNYKIITIENIEYLAIELDKSIRDTLQKKEIASSTLDSIASNPSLNLGQSRTNLASPNIKLSRRQRDLLPLLNAGLTNREVATQLGVSEHTVKVHLWRFFKKTNVNSRTQLLFLARTNGWI